MSGRTPKATFGVMKETYVKNILSYDAMIHGYSQFKLGRNSVETIGKVEVAVLKDHNITVRQLTKNATNSMRSAKKNIHDHFHMRICACSTSSLLTHTLIKAKRNHVPQRDFEHRP